MTRPLEADIADKRKNKAVDQREVVKMETNGKRCYMFWKGKTQFLEVNCGVKDGHGEVQCPGTWFTALMPVTEMG